MCYKVIVQDIDASSKEEALLLSANALKEKGYVKDSFYDACIEREKVYPTGVPSVVPVAIPHTDAEHVIEKAICISRLSKPIAFHSMENVESEINVEYIFNLAIKEGKDQMKMLKAIMKIAHDFEGLNKAKTMNLEDMKNYFMGFLGE